MPNVKVDSLQKGMVVTAEVKNIDNMLLIPASCALTEKDIQVLNAWGIAEVQVQSCDGVEDSRDILQSLSPERLQQFTDELKSIFWDPIDNHSAQQEVFGLVLRRKARQSVSH
jgi:hypothetical protein